MEPARIELAAAIHSTTFHSPICPIYQNATAEYVIDPEKIKENLVAQLTAPVLWTQLIRNMIADGATLFTEVGPGSVLQGLIAKIGPNVVVEGV
jgi:[acyl-carrier-protein] S-malonyltransferase